MIARCISCATALDKQRGPTCRACGRLPWEGQGRVTVGEVLDWCSGTPRWAEESIFDDIDEVFANAI